MTDALDDTTWVVVEPGVLVLPTTGYEIRFEKPTQLFAVWHDGVRLPGLGSLETMKWSAQEHMRQLMAAGIEP
jgi:hypothetical protein